MNPELFNTLCRVYEHYYKNRWHSTLKASDFDIPWFIGREQRKGEFSLEYRGMSLAAFIEGIRNNTTQIDGKPNKELMQELTAKFSGGLENAIFKLYWEEIIKEVEAHKGSVRPIVAGLSKLFMQRLFGPKSSQPRPEIIDSPRFDMAVSFQVGSLMYEYYSATKRVLTKFHDKAEQ